MPPINTKLKANVCDVPGCTWGPGGTPASYDMPQHLGLHKWHKHGIKGIARPGRTPKKAEIGRAHV